nr:hypothetical protein DO63_6216 [Burkholderia pseudomallei]
MDHADGRSAMGQATRRQASVRDHVDRSRHLEQPAEGAQRARARAVRREPQSRVRAPRAAVRAGERRGYPLREHVRVRALRRAACARVRSASRFAARASAHGHDCRRGGRRSVLRRRRPGARAGARPRSGGSRARAGRGHQRQRGRQRADPRGVEPRRRPFRRIVPAASRHGSPSRVSRRRSGPAGDHRRAR